MNTCIYIETDETVACIKRKSQHSINSSMMIHTHTHTHTHTHIYIYIYIYIYVQLTVCVCVCFIINSFCFEIYLLTITAIRTNYCQQHLTLMSGSQSDQQMTTIVLHNGQNLHWLKPRIAFINMSKLHRERHVQTQSLCTYKHSISHGLLC